LIDILPAQTSTSQAEKTEINASVTLTTTETSKVPIDRPLLEEVNVVSLRLPERIQAPSFEYSGMAWFGDYLVLLPQYPQGKSFSRESQN